MANITQPHIAGTLICKALGLDPSTVQKMVLTIAHDELITAKVTHLVTDDSANHLKEVLYELRNTGHELVPANQQS